MVTQVLWKAWHPFNQYHSFSARGNSSHSRQLVTGVTVCAPLFKACFSLFRICLHAGGMVLGVVCSCGYSWNWEVISEGVFFSPPYNRKYKEICLIWITKPAPQRDTVWPYMRMGETIFSVSFKSQRMKSRREAFKTFVTPWSMQACLLIRDGILTSPLLPGEIMTGHVPIS